MSELIKLLYPNAKVPKQYERVLKDDNGPVVADSMANSIHRYRNIIHDGPNLWQYFTFPHVDAATGVRSERGWRLRIALRQSGARRVVGWWTSLNETGHLLTIENTSHLAQAVRDYFGGSDALIGWLSPQCVNFDPEQNRWINVDNPDYSPFADAELMEFEVYTNNTWRIRE